MQKKQDILYLTYQFLLILLWLIFLLRVPNHVVEMPSGTKHWTQQQQQQQRERKVEDFINLAMSGQDSHTNHSSSSLPAQSSSFFSK